MDICRCYSTHTAGGLRRKTNPRCRRGAKIICSSVFGAVSATAVFGDFLTGCLVTLASLFVLFDISLEISNHRKGGK